MRNCPHRVSWPRGDYRIWYSSTWRELSDWCREVIGNNDEWDYLDEHFVFKNEEDKLLFMLRWK